MGEHCEQCNGPYRSNRIRIKDEDGGTSVVCMPCLIKKRMAEMQQEVEA